MEAPVSAFVHAARPVGGVALAVGDESEIEDALVACRREYEPKRPL